MQNRVHWPTSTERGGTHPVYRTPGLHFLPWRLDDAALQRDRLPAPGELMLWRLRAEWDATTRGLSPLDIPRKEQHRAIRGLSPALGKRYLVSRVFLRHTLSTMLGCTPAEIELHDHTEGELILRNPVRSPALEIRVAYAGVWILLAMSQRRLAIGAAVPEPVLRQPVQSPFDDARDRLYRESALRLCLPHDARDTRDAWPAIVSQNGAALIAETEAGGQIHVVDLPMPGQICAAVATHEPFDTIHAFGWPGG
ncbi:4'-phosphopantetheinyl transferase family protein [Paraburkholderia acidisoli]|uniref:4'-phosphopantetheinyl transferase n=1 Tax=Paraburkholderia acidisoli TaxID=2571748 RepID=A0A7Z2GPK5_9BURK|nr:hypothetical protein [Paraburkholderia acidisoli]QGZ65354.1 hypothetical protein FAZ98_26675 [Paraburkholderia acidisoli]